MIEGDHARAVVDAQHVHQLLGVVTLRDVLHSYGVGESDHPTDGTGLS